MPIFIKEANQALKKNMYEIPDKLEKHLKLTLSKYGNYTQNKGYKRLNALVNPEYNKRSNKADNFKDGKHISFSDLETIDHDFRHMNKNPKDLNRILNGGEEMARFARETLNKERTKVEPTLKVEKEKNRNKNQLKPTIKPMKPVKLGNIEATVHESVIKESYGEHPYYDRIMEYDERYVFYAFNNGENIWNPLINPEMYKKALQEFTTYGKLMRFPVKYIYQWMGIIMKNTALLRACTNICGHSNYFPIDDFVEIYFDGDEDAWENYKSEIGEDSDFIAAYEFLYQKGFDEWNKLPDGSDAMSDYGIEPIEEYIDKYNESMNPEDILVLINKIMDVVHCRGDLSSMFIVGGRKTLSNISESLKLNNKKIYITEEQLKLLKNELNK